MSAQEAVFKRDFYHVLASRLSKPVSLIQIICGPRQVGKTTAVKTYLTENSEQTTYFNVENFGSTPADRIRFEWSKVCQKPGHKVLIFDEIQTVANWGRVVKELFDDVRSSRELSLVLLGSSALDLLLRGEESLLGRFEIIRAPHWNYYETQRAFGWSLESFLQFGGYPILAELFPEQSKDTRVRAQQFVRDAIIEPVITRDIFSLQSIANTALFRQVLRITLSIPCEEISFAKLLGQLSEKGSSSSVKNYLELLEKAYLIRLLYRFSHGKVRQRTTSPKIVPLAPALVHAYSDPAKVASDQSWFGRVFEAAIIARIAELNYDLFYWSNSKEDVDLVIQSNDFVCAIEIKSNMNFDTKGLKAFKKVYPHAKAILIDRAAGESLLAAKDVGKELDFLIRSQEI